jgi:hypothetical protein
MYIALIVFVLAVAGYIGLLVFNKRSNASSDPRFAPYLNRPIVIKNPATLLWQKDENQTRFKRHSLKAGEYSSYETPELKSVKQYVPGDTVRFREAWTYYSLFVGTSPYLIGRETLENGEEVEFEYFASFDYLPAIWETAEEFRSRRERERSLEK